MTSNSPDSPFKVPPFSPKSQKPKVSYTWYSWHPLYPYWSKSCWGGDTFEKAEAIYHANKSFTYYHSKLIREEGGELREVANCPCLDISSWIDCMKKATSNEKAYLIKEGYLKE